MQLCCFQLIVFFSLNAVKVVHSGIAKRFLFSLYWSSHLALSLLSCYIIVFIIPLAI